MAGAPIQNGAGLDAGLHGADGGLQFGNHAAGDDLPARQQFLRLLEVHLLDEPSLVVEHAGDIGQQHQARSFERRRQGAGHGVGVDVVGGAVAADPDGSDHGDHALVEQRHQQGRVDLLWLADEAEVDILPVAGGRQFARHNQGGVLARDADAAAAGAVEKPGQLFVDAAAQHHLGDLDGGAVGDAQPVGETAADAEAIEHGLDARRAAMHHHRTQAAVVQQHDILGETGAGGGVLHGVAAVFDHDGLAGILLHEGQRLGEQMRLAQPFLGLPAAGGGFGRGAFVVAAGVHGCLSEGFFCPGFLALPTRASRPAPGKLSNRAMGAPCRRMITPCCRMERKLFQAQ